MLGPPLLLHIAHTATRVTTLDPAILAGALVALALAAVAIWLPRSACALPDRRNRRRAAAAATAMLVFLALLPSIVPYDHLLPQDEHASGDQASIHVSHCHVSPGTCSDAPVTTGPGQLLLGAALVVEPAMLAVLITLTSAMLVGISYRPAIRPPLSLPA